MKISFCCSRTPSVKDSHQLALRSVTFYMGTLQPGPGCRSLHVSVFVCAAGCGESLESSGWEGATCGPQRGNEGAPGLRTGQGLGQRQCR